MTNNIIKYFEKGIYTEEQTYEYIKHLNNCEIIISQLNFYKLSKIHQKKIYPFIKRDQHLKDLSLPFLLDINATKDQYLLTELEMKYYQNKIDDFFNDNNNLENYYLDPYNLTRFGYINNLNNISKVTNCVPINHDFKYIKYHNTIQKLGFYILPKNVSPGFKNFRRIVHTLKNYFNISLFVDNLENELDSDDKKFFEGVDIHYIANMQNYELADYIYSKQLTILICIYGFYKRKSTITAKPAPIVISYQEPPVIYPKNCYDYNLIDINLYKTLKEYGNINENNFNFITLKKTFILPTPYYSDFINITEPIYDSNSIRIGLIANAPKISHEIIKLIKKIIKLNPNIIVTIYGYMNKEWINSLFDSSQVIHDIYDNTNPTNLLDNILYIDPVIINSHSTSLEILKLKRPIIGYYNPERYLGSFSHSIITALNMQKYLLADNINDYVKLVKLYTYNADVYYSFYKKFKKKLKQFPITSDQYYVDDFVETLNSFYNNYYEEKIKNII